MPYIKQEYRNRIDKEIDALAGQLLGQASLDPEFQENLRKGIFNYVITRLAVQLIGTTRYGKINDIVGAMECCKMELYRRLASPYEDDKKEENGDVL